MKQLPSNKTLMNKYCLNEKELLKLMQKCIQYYLSEEELYEFILEAHMKKEMKLNKRHSCYYY